MTNIDEYGEIIEKNNNSVRKRERNNTKYILFFFILFIAFVLYLMSNKQIFNKNQNTNKIYVSEEIDENIFVEWQKTFGGSSPDWAYSLIQTTNGGYAVAGATYSKGAGSCDCWVIKLDGEGNIVWEKTFGGIRSDRACSLIQADDGGYALAGETESYGAGKKDFWVIKFSEK